MIGWAGRGTGNDCRVGPPRKALNDDGLGAIEGNHCPPIGLLLRLCPSRYVEVAQDITCCGLGYGLENAHGLRSSSHIRFPEFRFEANSEYPTNHQGLSGELERRAFLGARLISFPH
jgi:hypothetical protein